ncbi:MAG: hypothetical protein NTW52_15410 [Planctomycetota bacterium]|nr:hypothetical protein [Planctomycetota bacterium]
MNLFALIIVSLPLAVYCLMIGMLHRSKHPFLVSGGRDMALLGLAMLGLVLVGPSQLFFPVAAFNLLGPAVWFLMTLLYFFIVLFVILNSRPRLVVFGLAPDALAMQVKESLDELNIESTWMGPTFAAPGIRVDGTIEQAGNGELSQIVATRSNQDVIGWMKLERALAIKLKSIPIEPRSTGTVWIALGLAALAALGLQIYSNPTAVADGMKELLRL